MDALEVTHKNGKRYRILPACYGDCKHYLEEWKEDTKKWTDVEGGICEWYTLWHAFEECRQWPHFLQHTEEAKQRDKARERFEEEQKDDLVIGEKYSLNTRECIETLPGKHKVTDLVTGKSTMMTHFDIRIMMTSAVINDAAYDKTRHTTARFYEHLHKKGLDHPHFWKDDREISIDFEQDDPPPTIRFLSRLCGCRT